MNLSGLVGLSAGPQGYTAQQDEMAGADYRRAQAQQLQELLMGRAAFGRAVQSGAFGGMPGAMPMAPAPQPPMPGQPSVPMQAGPPSPGGITPQMQGDMPVPRIQEAFAAFPQQGSGPVAPMQGPMPPPGAPPPVAPGGGAVPGGPPGMPQQPMDWRQMAQMIVQANPGAPPQVIAAALDQAMPLMNQQSQQEWRMMSLQLREELAQQREQGLDRREGSRSADRAAGRDVRVGIEERREGGRMERAQLSAGTKTAIANLNADTRREIEASRAEGREMSVNARKEIAKLNVESRRELTEYLEAGRQARFDTGEEGRDRRFVQSEEGRDRRQERSEQGRTERAQLSAATRREIEESRAQGRALSLDAKREIAQLNVEARREITQYLEGGRETRHGQNLTERERGRESAEAGRTERHGQNLTERERSREQRGQQFESAEAGRETRFQQREARTGDQFHEREGRLASQFQQVQDNRSQRLDFERQRAIQRAEQAAATMAAGERKEVLSQAREANRAHDSYMRNRINASAILTGAEKKAMIAQLDKDWWETEQRLQAIGKPGAKPAGGAGGAGGAGQAAPSAGGAMPPPEALKHLKEGEPTTFGNGQKWMLKNGSPTRVE